MCFHSNFLFSLYILPGLRLQEAARDAVKRCTVDREPVGRWDIYSTTPVSPAVPAVSPLDVSGRLIGRSTERELLADYFDRHFGNFSSKSVKHLMAPVTYM